MVCKHFTIYKGIHSSPIIISHCYTTAIISSLCEILLACKVAKDPNLLVSYLGNNNTCSVRRCTIMFSFFHTSIKFKDFFASLLEWVVQFHSCLSSFFCTYLLGWFLGKKLLLLSVDWYELFLCQNTFFSPAHTYRKDSSSNIKDLQLCFLVEEWHWED